MLASHEAARCLAEAILPAGRHRAAGGAATWDEVERRMLEGSATAARVVRGLTDVLDRAAILRTGRRFSRLSPGERETLLRAWEDDPLARWPLFAVSFLLRSVHWDHPEYFAAMDRPFERGGPDEPAPWTRQIRPATEIATGDDLECDAVVVGTGAGGAVVGAELAARGHAVVFLEEGSLHRRSSFRLHAPEAQARFFRRAGMIPVGNALIFVLAGRLVGGSTAVNTATCFRTPERVLDEWCDRLGTDVLSPERMRPHFERVERTLGVAPARPERLGGVARVVARGCDRLGWHHFPVSRNAPDCDAQGVCELGCPSGARRSMDATYIPSALGRGAVLVTEARVDRVIVEGRRAAGVEAVAPDGRRLRVRARAVVLAGGSIPTPLLLLGQGICNESGQVGRNLSLHPCAIVGGLFDEPIRGFDAIPQGYGCDEHLARGTLLMGASPSLDLAAAPTLPLTGRRLVDAMDSLDRIASFMVIVRDESRGRVRRLPSGSPLLTYRLIDRDLARLREGMTRIGEIFEAAGARRLYLAASRRAIVDGPGAAAKVASMTLAARDLLLVSYHPLGTCRMGEDPKTSVVGLDHETHALRDLFVIDGSTVPGPPGVNPQLTIMAMATRAAGIVADRLGRA